MAVHSQGEQVLDVDAMSSDGCAVHMLSEGEYNIHRFQLRTSILFFFACCFAEVKYMGGQHCPLSNVANFN